MSKQQELSKKITELRSKVKVSQIVVSRVVKTRNGGDIFVSLTGNYGAPEDQEESLSMDEVKLASHLLGLQVNILAFQQAAASGLIDNNTMSEAIKKTKNNFGHFILEGNQ
jgi:hypothetical protein